MKLYPRNRREPSEAHRWFFKTTLEEANLRRVAALQAQQLYWARVPARLADVAAHIIMERRLRNLQTAIDTATLGEV